MDRTTPALEIKDLDFRPQDGRPVFSGLTFSVPRGAFVLVRGASGAGKSTLLRLLARLDEPTSGLLRFNGQDYAHYAPPYLRSRICYLQQSPTVLDNSVRRNLLLPFGFKQLKGCSLPSDEQLRDGLDALLLHKVNLEDNASLLSVGQKQRLCLARTLLLEPEVLLLDEPVSALDPESRQVVEDLTDTVHAKGVTVLLVTHNERETHEQARPHVLELGTEPRIPEALQ